ncbi:DUF6185 family protein [Streptomyces cinnamoneus]|uniref:Uncharacterized protein n=1 Tax=Streptomyces cinnamoneus TaxID=53446 RepID=A0A918TSB5_STRCJ|nr:DUF6185 family protein [Streptomyces cinnamoneus]GHC59948.1 hypothetical protein GCM10010507_41130 [Streptomyces cinnamoneus]
MAKPEKSSSTSLWWWGMVKAVLGVMVLLLYKAIPNIADVVTSPTPGWLGQTMRWPVLIGVVAGWLLVATARPRGSVLVASSALATAAGVVAAAPPLVGLPSPAPVGSLHRRRTRRTRSGAAWCHCS